MALGSFQVRSRSSQLASELGVLMETSRRSSPGRESGLEISREPDTQAEGYVPTTALHHCDSCPPGQPCSQPWPLCQGETTAYGVRNPSAALIGWNRDLTQPYNTSAQMHTWTTGTGH